MADGGDGDTAHRRGVLVRGLGVLWRAVRAEPRIFTVAVLGSSLFGLLTIGTAYVVGAVTGRVVIPAIERGEVVPAALATGAGALIALSALRVASVFARRLGAGVMQYRLQASYRRQVTRKYLDLPVAWHQRNATGTLLSNANADVEAAWYPIAPLPFAVGTLVMLVAAVGSLFAVDWVLALVGCAIFPVLFALNVVYSRRMAPRQARAQRLRAEVSAIAHESFDGALVVKTMGREAAETQRFGDRAAQLRDALIQAGRVRGLFDPILETLPSLGTLAVLVVGAVRLRQGAIDIADVVSVAFLFTVLAFPVRTIGWVLAELPRSVAGWDRVERVITATGEMAYGTSTLDGRAGAATLRMESVTFAYEGADPVLHGVSFEVPAGRTVALVGPTGSGKSTIASLAARLVDPQAGTVRLDGLDVRELSAPALAATVALVPQIPFVFDDTVRDNVTLGRPGIDDAAVWRALRLAQADRFVAALGRMARDCGARCAHSSRQGEGGMARDCGARCAHSSRQGGPEGLDAVVGERGTSLSGGQRQRLTLARALAGGPRLLVLDDATSAVDPRVEAAILAGLRGAARGRSGPATSILVIAYRRATIALADEVVYVEHGRVVARGSHRRLLDTVPGYANLVTAYEQAEAERERERAYEDVEVAR